MFMNAVHVDHYKICVRHRHGQTHFSAPSSSPQIAGTPQLCPNQLDNRAFDSFETHYLIPSIWLGISINAVPLSVMKWVMLTFHVFARNDWHVENLTCLLTLSL